MASAHRWPGDARLAMSFVVNVEEGSEMTVADGDRGPEADATSGPWRGGTRGEIG